MTESLQERFNRLTTREKIILFATSTVLIWGIWDNIVYQPIADKKNKLATELATIKSQLTIQQQAAEQIEVLRKIDPNKENKQKLREIKAKLSTLKQNLDISEKKFVPAQLMVKVLRDLLKQTTGLNLIALETLPVSSFSVSKQKKSSIYRHGLTLTLSGSYFNTLHYLKKLETLPWRFNWESIDYQVKEYPVAETTLKLYTLSFEESWLEL